jgi:hypothetical protein
MNIIPNNIYSGIYKSFLIASIILFILFFFSRGSVAYGSVITGYTTFIIGILMILLQTIEKNLETTQNIYRIMYSVMYTNTPLFLLLGYVGLVLYLIIYNKSKIENKHVSANFFSFHNIFIILIFVQTYLIYLPPNKLQQSILYLFNIITLIITVILYTILTYFTTDGYTNREDKRRES